MNRIVSFIALLLVSLTVAAKHVEPTKALRVATHFASSNSASGLRSTSDLQLIYTAIPVSESGLRSSDTPLFYVYNVSGNNGFVIVSADDHVSPVLGYAGEGSFRVENMPVNLKNRLKVYEDEIEWIIESGYEASDEIIQQWSELLSGSQTKASGEVVLSTPLWDQLRPYNELCPLDGDEATVAGCVATSMAILMKYNEWPEKGKGTKRYKTRSSGLSINADFNVTYDWENMLHAYTRNSSGFPQWNKQQGEAVATLIYHAGAASKMDYGTESSGAYEWDAFDALITNFDYDKSMYMACRDLYTDNEWNTLLKSEIDAGRPLLYGGVTKDREGHEFIVDGYNATNYYHVNWGWSGYANGYYLLSSLKPTVQGTGGSKEGEGYALEQNAIIGVQKAQAGSSMNHEIYFLEKEVLGQSTLDKFAVYGLSTNVDMIVKGEPFKLYFSYLMDYGRRSFSGTWGFFIVDKNGNRKAELETFKEDLPGMTMLYNIEGGTYTITTDVKEGDKIRLLYSSDGQTWKPVRGKINSDTVTELPIGVKLGMSNDKLPLPQGINVSPTLAASSIIVRSDNYIPFTEVKVYDYSGRLVADKNYPSGEIQTTISVDHLTAGTYIVSVHTAEGVSNHKIIKR